MTILKITEGKGGLFERKPFCRLPCNRLRVKKVNVGDVSVKTVAYETRNGRVGMSRLKRACKGDFGNLIYVGDRPIDSKSLGVFYPFEYYGRLCGNLGITCLQIMGKNGYPLRVGLYDPKGDFADYTELIATHSREAVVVTENTHVYRDESRRLLWEMGTPLSVCKKADSLKDCDLIIAPAPLKSPVALRRDSVLLTVSKPIFDTGAKVYYKYAVKLPEPYSELSEFTEDTALVAGGLYSLCRIHSLGSVVPLLCSGDSDTQTYLSLCKSLLSQHLT